MWRTSSRRGTCRAGPAAPPDDSRPVAPAAAPSALKPIEPTATAPPATKAPLETRSPPESAGEPPSTAANSLGICQHSIMKMIDAPMISSADMAGLAFEAIFWASVIQSTERFIPVPIKQVKQHDLDAGRDAEPDVPLNVWSGPP